MLAQLDSRLSSIQASPSYQPEPRYDSCPTAFERAHYVRTGTHAIVQVVPDVRSGQVDHALSAITGCSRE